MDVIAEEDFEEEVHARGGRRGRGGVTDVTFSVFVHPAPATGETVCLSGSIAELQNPLPMQPNQMGDRKLWHLTVQINAASIVPPPAQQAPAAMIGLMQHGSLISALGGGRGTAAATIFEYSYTVQNAAGGIVRQDEGSRPGETGELKQLYYHKATFGAPEGVQDEGFKLFINDEIFQLQSGQITVRDFHRRMVALAASGFNKKRALLDKALEELINHWGMDTPAPAQVVLAVAAAMGTMKRNTQGVTMYGFESFENDYSFSSMVGSKEKEKEKEDPPSLMVCRWIVMHCPSRADVEEEQRGERERGRESRSMATTAGVRLAAETLYKEEQTFDWLKLLNFLPEHSLPQPVNASQCSRDEARKLTESFFRSMKHVFDDFQRSKVEFDSNPPADAKDRQKAEQEMQTRMELFLRGLCTFCPSVECMKQLVLTLRETWEPLVEVMIPMIFSRFRSIHFGKDDKERLQEMIRDIPFMNCDETAIALLQNQNHPNDAFKEREIATFVNQVTQNSMGGARAAGPQLQNAARRWLVRYYGRPVDRPMERKEDKASVTEMTRNEYQVMKKEIREAMKNALGGWQLILELPCFKQEEDTVRNLLFELSQSYFFKDQDPLLVLDCILDLEKEAEQMKLGAPLQEEIRRIATKSIRDAQEASESDIDSNLLQLLFDTPTRLRYYIIENFITLRQAATGLKQLLLNFSIWKLLLSRKWLNAQGISELPLYSTQQTGMKMLTESAKQLDKGTICLDKLHTIIKYRDKYEPLVEQVATRPTAITESSQKIFQFDTEYKHLKTFLIRFCQPAKIEATDLEKVVEGIHKDYDNLELNVAAGKFSGLKVREHLAWLFSLNASEVFSGIWKQTARPEGENSERVIEQEEVVNTIIPSARKTWEDLAKSIETGQAILKDIKWVVESTMPQVNFELKLLESTAPKSRTWVNEATDLCKSMRLAAKLRLWAPSMLHLRNQSLSALFKESVKDEYVEKLNQVVCEYEHMWTKTLGEMTTSVTPYKEIINTLSEAMQDYTITAAKHDQSLEWLLNRSSTENFNLLLSLCTPNTDDPIILTAIASLKQMRTFLAEALFTKPPYAGLKKFIEELAKLNVDTAEQQCLEAVQKSFDPMLELLTTHSRTPGVQACYDLTKIHSTGTFHVKCALTESAQLKCRMPPESEFDYEALAELRRQLLMTDVPYELDTHKNLPMMLDILVKKLQLLEDFGRCTMELYRLGHFAYRLNNEVLVVPPEDSVESVANRLEAQQQQLEDWQNAVSDARSKHYFLNYYTVRELCFLTDLLPSADKDEDWNRVWPLLQCVDLSADEEKTRKTIENQLKGDLELLRSSSQESDKEVKLLNDVGKMLGELFEHTPPQVRPLEGLTEVKQQLQGDLLIRSMQNKEQGIPIFVCCADEACKVTELVLSIYTRRERVPEAEELLLCSSHTTLEEIELLLRRFFHARKHHREDRLYCVGNVHLLPYVTQCGTVEALRKMEEQFGFEHASALVFASGLPNQMLTNALNRHNLAVSVLQQDLLKNAVAMVGEKYHGRQLEAVAAQMNGVGKTHHIHRQIHRLQDDHQGKPLLHHVEIRETTDISALVSNLLSDPTDPATPTAVHIDLAHILPSHVDTLLFELLIVGMLRDTHLCRVYHRRAKKDFFFIEIPNTPGESTAKQLSFCLILPRVYLTMSADRLDEEMPVIKEVDGAPLVTFVKNDLLELVGKTLEAMRKEAFNPKSRHFDVQWTGAKAKPIEIMRTYELLEEICCSETSPPSFLVFMNLVKFLGHLIKSAEEWNMMNLALLQNFDPGLKHFKHCFFRLLIETSRDFALRQVPKAMDSTAAASILAPPVLAPGMSRGGSRGSDANMPPELLRNLSGMSGPPSLTRKTSGQRAAPSLQRQQSRAQQEIAAQHEADAKMEKEGVGRIDASAYVARFDQMPSWESCIHPVANFKKNDRGNIIGCNIMSLQRDFIGNFIDRNLQNSLNLNDLKLDRDWSKVTHQDAVQLVHQIEGGSLLQKKDYLQGPKDYVVTVDNLIKLMSIQQRLKYGLPVILMGETGCGKTALVKFLAETLNFSLFTLDIHGGITDASIVKFLEDAIQNATSDRGVLVFFDEINAANCMALFKTIIIDRMYGNKVIPENVRIISCCNPYRKRRNKELEDVALVYNAAAGDAASGISDPMKELVYRVHPLPESLIDVVSDFGSLSEASEEIYIKAILRKELPRKDELGLQAQGQAAAGQAQPEAPDDYEVFINAFCELLCQSQNYVREVNEGERSVVSMRDIGRAARVFKWFLTSYSKLHGDSASAAVRDDKDGTLKIDVCVNLREHLRRALVLTMGYCYHSRLNRNQRWGYRKRLCETWERLRTKDDGAMEWLHLADANELNKMLIDTSFEFVSQMDLGEGIALNEALRENLFMLLVSVMNQIPILLIGKPGCSKSLAMGVLQNNLNGEVSSRDFFKSMPAVDVFAYQCSPLSTPDAILNAFHSARQSNLGHKSTIVCVLLDEVGLAEESPHLPLKVLHKELEDLRGIACVGISNWALDAAKMSRCVTLYRPPPTVEDLSITAQGMVQSENLKSYLRALSEAFAEIYKRQKRADFWGMREFYSTVRVINAALKIRAAAGLEAVLEEKVLMKTVQRNFGGQPEDELENCIEEFFERTGMDFADVDRLSTQELIKQNLEEPDARHLMLLTKNNAALRLLFEGGLLDHSRAEVMFGSTFPNDLSDMFVAMNLQRIKSFMQQPVSLVMVHCDSLYESLYDLLNQHYMEYAGQRYVRIAHGSKAKQCPIHKLFRVIVVTELSDAYFRLAPPLLNRFEKQIFLRKDLMTKADEALLARVNKFWHTLNELMNAGKTVQDEDALEEAQRPRTMLNTASHRPIAGYHPELLSSLVFTLRKRHVDRSLDELVEMAKRALTWVLTPEAVCITAATLQPNEMHMKFGFDIVSEYFEKQRHSDLPSFAEMTVENKDFWCDEYGSQTMVMTYSPIRGKVGSELAKVNGLTAKAEVSLHELSSSTDIEKAVQDFYNLPETAGSKNFLIIHADPVAASVRMIEHCRFVCEKARNSYCQKGKGAPGSMFVVLVVHLQRGYDGKFSFDFDSQWSTVFLDSVEPSADLSSMPSLGAMLNMPLIDVVEGLEFPKLLRSCFRSSLSRLMYPHSRRPDDLQRQIQLMLKYIEDADFVKMVRDWVLHVLRNTPKNRANLAEGSVGDDRHWFAAIASAAQELALAGTFRAALHGRVVVLVGSLLSALLAHLERNSGLELLDVASKREHWLKLCTASLLSPVLSARLQAEAISALTESATAQHEVGTDAYTAAKPFVGRFPASWFISKVIDGVRHIIEQNETVEQLAALQSQYQISKLAEIGIDPEMSPEMLDDYMADFTAMHLDWTERVDRDGQLRIVKKILTRLRKKPLTSILEVHQLFWCLEKELAFSVSLLNAVPQAVPEAERLIEEAELNSLYYDLLLLVHETLAMELAELDSSMSMEKSQELYRGWLMRKLVVAGLTKDKLMAGHDGVDKTKIKKLKSNTEPRIETLALLLQHVAYPLSLPPEVVGAFANDLPKEKIRYSGTLLAMLNFGQVVVNQSGKNKEVCLLQLSSFIESWFLDVCLRDEEAMNDLEPTTLRLVCSVAAGLPTLRAQAVSGVAAGSLEGWSENQDSGIAQLAEGLFVPRSSCLNLALLRKLIVSSSGDAKDSATKHIEDLLKVVAEHEKHNDTLFATRYAILQEEDKDADHGKCTFQEPEDWPALNLEDIFGKEVKPNTALMLQRVGKCRYILARYADILIQDPVDTELHQKAVPKVDGLLQTDKPEFRSVCRSMRLYLLKCMERARGLSFVRSLLAMEPLSETGWVKKWRDLHDIDFEKFIGAALVPKWNPFIGESQDLAEYREAMTAVVELMTTTSTAKLSKFAQDFGSLPEEKRRRHVGGLLLALAQEPGLVAALEEPHHRPPWRPMLCEWLANSNDLKVTEKERMLLRIFSGDDTPLQNLPEEEKKYLETFVTYGGRKMDDLLRWRVLGHLAAVLIAAPETSLLHTLRSMMLEPESMMRDSLTYLPAMDEDIRSRVLKALVERGENIWKFKSHWWKCSCGFTFFIGECGRPMEVAKCPGCSLNIGGRDHNQTEHTFQDDENDRSPWGYVLPPSEKDEKHVSFREVQSSSARAIRLLLHGSMFLGVMTASKNPTPRVYSHWANESMCTLHERSESEYIGQHFANDWKSMVDILSSNTEDLAVGLHNLLLRMSEEVRDEPLKPFDTPGPLKWGVLTLNQRNAWEETIESKYLKTLIKNLDDSLQDLYKKWGGDSEDGKFVAELKEAADVKDFPPPKREAEMPQLWAYRSAVTLDALHNKIAIAQSAKENFPVLCTVLQNPLIHILRALGTLVGVFEWQHLCINQFSGRITKAQAGERTVREVLDTVPRNAAEKRKWEQAFKNFQLAWKLAMPYCEYECLQINETMREKELTDEDALLWCIPDLKDEGMYALAVIDWLVAQHNELVQIVARTLGYPARKVSSRLLVQHDVIKYARKELMRFLSNRCATWGVGGKLNLDLKQVEQHLRRELSRPEITIEMRGFQWLGDSYAGGNELKTVITQRELLPDTIDRLKVEIPSPALANACLQKVQMSISFILKSGSSLGTEKSGEMLLSDYMRRVLAESPENFMSAAARSEVHLWHVDSLVKVLKQIVNKDPVDSMDPKYKEELPSAMRQKLIEAKEDIPDQLVEVMGSFGETRLTETYIGVEYDILTILQSIRETLEINDEIFEEIEKHLPADLKMKHWAEVYKLLRD